MLKCHVSDVTLSHNNGDNKEWAVCALMGHMRTRHDASRFDCASDVDAGDMQISVKSGRFTLFSGKIAYDNGIADNVDAHLAFYMANTHSNVWAYVCNDNTVFFMDADEFTAFVRNFCKMEPESAKNKGYMKARLGRQNKRYRAWLESLCGE